ncbi:MAG: antitoxin VbhA family protein [Bifidobacteriaceae bacterium]|nr:antitoxin VbhA family protein [Bifidobacteriaceae bacterium]
MVTNLEDRRKLADAAAGSVRAEGLAPSPHAQSLVDRMVDGSVSADEALLELVERHRTKTPR